MATGSLYDLNQLELHDEDVLVEVGGKDHWSAMSSALQTNISYEFVSDVPFEYMDFRQRYLVTKVDPGVNMNQGARGGGTSPRLKKKFLLAYCFCVKVQDSIEHGEGSVQIPSAIIEDIIADVELMKGQSSLFGDKFQVFDDVCISYGGLAMSTGRTFDNDGSARRIPSSNLSNSVQVTLIHEQIPNLNIEDNMSETDPEWENQIEISHLIDQTLFKKMRHLLEERQLLPLVCKVLNMLSSLRDQYFYEFELQTPNLMVTTSSTQGSDVADFDVMLVNQSIPLVYRHMIQTQVSDLYGETKYEFNDVLMLCKIAALFVQLATDLEPVNK